MTSHRPRLQERVFGSLAEAATARPGWTIVASLALAAVALVLALARIELKTSNLDLVDPDLPEVARFRDFAQSFGTPNVLVVVLEGNDPARLRTAVDRTAAEIRGGHGVRAVFSRLPYEPMSLLPLAMMGIDPYFTSRDRTMAFLFVQPTDPDSSAETIAPFVQAVREKIAAAHLETEGIHAGLTGLPQYALDDRDIIQRDTSRLSAVSFLLILALFALGFSEFSRPLLASVTLAVSAVFVVGVIAIVPGHLTLVSATFFSALFGLGIDYGTYVVDRFEEHLADGWAKREALVSAVRELGPGLTTGALTTAFAFYTMMFSGFRGFQELGFIGGTGIVIALFLMATLLPALLMLVGGKRRRERPLLERRVGRFLGRIQRPGLAVAMAVVALVALAGGLPRFDGDYLNLQPKDSEAVRLERKMIEKSAFSPQFAAFVVDTPEKAKEITEKLRTQDTVGTVRSAADVALLDGLAKPIPGEHDAFLASFKAKDGRLAVYAYPNGNVWDPAFESRFLAQMRAIDPHVTGMPVLGRFMIDLSKRALLVTAALSALVIVVLVLLDLKKPLWSALALLPTVLSVAATLASMRLLGLDFNPLNVMALPVILGTVVDAGAHVVHRFREERGDLDRTLAGSGAAVLLCVLTTIVGFGALIFTTHRGLASFGIILTLGSTWSMLFSLYVLPGILKLVAARQEKSHESLQALARNHQGLP
ncbi:MAG TPA: MMPL family transporter [Thermoanaerobaculia bacterium]|nr:MMPL family transporter [Thermoanaerobaculia bacterium]